MNTTHKKKKITVFDKRLGINTIYTKELENLPNRTKEVLKRFFVTVIGRPILLPTESDPSGLDTLKQDQTILKMFKDFLPGTTVQKAQKRGRPSKMAHA